MLIRMMLMLLAGCIVVNAAAADSGNHYTLYLVRHAEKQINGSRDPALTPTGRHRAQQLAYWFRDKGIKDVWSSDFARTLDTAKPLLSSLGLEPEIYNPGNQADLAEKLLHKQRTAVIIGHSNTIPELARLLCNCPVADMDESEYERLIVIAVSAAGTQVKTLRQNRLFQPQDR